MVSAADLPPGGEGKIEVKVSTNGLNGPLTKTIEVFSNDPATPRLRLTVSGRVENPAPVPARPQ